MTPQEMNEFANAFYGDLMTVYQKAFTENVQPMFGLPVRNEEHGTYQQASFQKLSDAVLTRLAAILAADVGLSRDQYLEIAAQSYDQTVAVAPRFG
jgi:hypothetical protein